jgi:hypothetical protein
VRVSVVQLMVVVYTVSVSSEAGRYVGWLVRPSVAGKSFVAGEPSVAGEHSVAGGPSVAERP